MVLRALLLFLLFITAASADTKLSNLPAGVGITDPDLLYCAQGGGPWSSAKCTALQLKTYVSGLTVGTPISGGSGSCIVYGDGNPNVQCDGSFILSGPGGGNPYFHIASTVRGGDLIDISNNLGFSLLLTDSTLGRKQWGYIGDGNPNAGTFYQLDENSWSLGYSDGSGDHDVVKWDSSGDAHVTRTIQHGISTVANLPTCNGASEGAHYGVTNALLPSFLAPVAGGGAVHAAVYCDGTNWVTD